MTLISIYPLIFSLFLILYGFNKVLIVGGVKLFYLFVPVLISYIFIVKKFIIPRELKIILLISFVMILSVVSTLVYYPDALKTVIFANIRVFLIFLILIPFYTIYLENPHRIDRYLPLVIFVFMVSNIVHYFFFYDFSDRFEGVFGGANEFAAMLIFYIYVSYYLLSKSPGKFYKMLLLISLLGLHLLVFVTLSRGALIGLGLFYLFAGFYFKQSLSSGQKKFVLLVVVLLGLVSLNFLTQSAELFAKRFTGSEGKHSLESRSHEIEASFNMLSEHIDTIVLGNGTSISSDMYTFRNFYDDKNYDVRAMRIHNTYIALLTENGILVLMLFLYYLFEVARKAWKCANPFKYAILGYGAFSMFFMLFIYMFYFLPFWLGLFLIDLHLKTIKVAR